ncbi:hypothetical protein COR53_02455 [Staphylococcus pettenkoferi]|nr:hypothetical protein COR53_02455 [Staphylococcus pettenkoferi]
MWSILLISKEKREKFVLTKALVIFLLTTIMILLFSIINLVLAYVVTGNIPNISEYYYLIITTLLGELGPFSIIFFLSLILQNKVYIICFSFFITLFTLLVPVNKQPFKLPEFIVNSSKIIAGEKIQFIDFNFLINGSLSIIILIIIVIISIIYIRKEEF